MIYILRNDNIRDNCISDIMSRSLDTLWQVEIREHHSKRSLEQNAYLHAVPLKIIADHTGFSLEEIKDYLLGEAFGWDEKKVFGRTVQRPLRRSSDLNQREFSWFIEWLEAWAMNQLGLLIPMPNEITY